MISGREGLNIQAAGQPFQLQQYMHQRSEGKMSTRIQSYLVLSIMVFQIISTITVWWWMNEQQTAGANAQGQLAQDIQSLLREVHMVNSQLSKKQVLVPMNAGNSNIDAATATPMKPVLEAIRNEFDNIYAYLESDSHDIENHNSDAATETNERAAVTTCTQAPQLTLEQKRITQEAESYSVALMDKAVETGTLSAQDITQLNSSMNMLTGEAKDRAYNKFVDMVNKQKIDPEVLKEIQF